MGYLERREVEKRISSKERHTAHGFRILSVVRIIDVFERLINEMKTK